MEWKWYDKTVIWFLAFRVTLESSTNYRKNMDSIVWWGVKFDSKCRGLFMLWLCFVSTNVFFIYFTHFSQYLFLQSILRLIIIRFSFHFFQFSSHFPPNYSFLVVSLFRFILSLRDFSYRRGGGINKDSNPPRIASQLTYLLLTEFRILSPLWLRSFGFLFWRGFVFWFMVFIESWVYEEVV